MDTEKVNESFGKDEEQPKSITDDRSDNLFNRVNLRPFELHSNTTSANVSRKNSFMNKTQED
jgi:hypothetical protein